MLSKKIDYNTKKCIISVEDKWEGEINWIKKVKKFQVSH